MPSVQVNPTEWPAVFAMCATSLVVVVLPFVPVTATIGMREGVPGGKSIFNTGSATFLALPFDGDKCMRKPGAAFTSITAPLSLVMGDVISSAIMSTPHISRFISRATLSTKKILNG